MIPDVLESFGWTYSESVISHNGRRQNKGPEVTSNTPTAGSSRYQPLLREIRLIFELVFPEWDIREATCNKRHHSNRD